MSDVHSRRGFLRGLARHAARGAQEVGDTLRPTGPLAGALTRPEPVPAPPASAAAQAGVATTPRLTPARPAARLCTTAELMDLAATYGLAPRADEIVALARQSVRVTPHDAGAAGAWLGGGEELRDTIAWPESDAGPLTLVAQVQLADAAMRGVGLPVGERLAFFLDAERHPSGTETARSTPAEVLVVGDGGEPSGQAAVLSAELVLPRVWSAAVQSLDMTSAEQEAYVRLRHGLAERQDVEIEDGAGRATAYHHLLGYPHDTSGTLPALCELAARGDDPDAAAILEIGAMAAARWVLLAEFTFDLTFGPVPDHRAGRAFFWIPAGDLDAGDLSNTRAVWVDLG